MDAHALLSAQGWRGHGHSLHKTDDSIGLSKPLYLNRKNNTKGLGVKEHHNNDQWWLHAFDEQLKGLETSKKGGVKQTVSTGKLNTIKTGAAAKYSVYASFVSGGLLQGTLDLLDKQSASTTSSDSTTSESETAGTKKTRSKDSKKAKETKEERRARKEARRIRKEARAVRRAARQARRERKKAKAAAKLSSSDSSDATDEEKRKRRAKKEERRRRRKMKE